MDRTIKVERILRESPDGYKPISRIRLQGKWLEKVFQPGTHVRVRTVEAGDSSLFLVLEGVRDGRT